MIVAIIQARIGSNRLPRKVARLIAGKTMLARVIERTQQIPDVSDVVVATSVLDVDDWVVTESQRCGIRTFRGPDLDVLGRYVGAAKWLGLKPSDHIVRITADCPLLDPVVSQQVIHLALINRVDYASNTRDWPDGLDTEVFAVWALQEATYFAASPEDREHVTPWMRRNLFCLELVHDPPLRHVKFSVDTVDDLEYARELAEALGSTFGWQDILRVVPGRICPNCARGYPHRRYPLGSVTQRSATQPMVTAWDLHAEKDPLYPDGIGLKDDPECLAPEVARRASETPRQIGGAPAPGATVPKSLGADPTSG